MHRTASIHWAMFVLVTTGTGLTSCQTATPSNETPTRSERSWFDNAVETRPTPPLPDRYATILSDRARASGAQYMVTAVGARIDRDMLIVDIACSIRAGHTFLLQEYGDTISVLPKDAISISRRDGYIPNLQYPNLVMPGPNETSYPASRPITMMPQGNDGTQNVILTTFVLGDRPWEPGTYSIGLILPKAPRRSQIELLNDGILIDQQRHLMEVKLADTRPPGS